jgi:hypothetical protein
MKKVFFMAALISCMVLGTKNVSAQYYFFDGEYYDNPFLYEAGISLNAMNCLTDMGGHKGIGKKFLKDLNMGKTSISGGVFFNVAYKNAVALRLEGTFGQISGNDNVLTGVTDIAKERFNRNLNFRSNITDVNLMLEIHPMYIFVDWPAKETTPPRTSPYLLAGIGYFTFNPQTKVVGSDRWIDLQPLHTEGQGFVETNIPNYSLQQLNIPIGAGVKYELSPLVNLRGEVVYRKTFTDYLDDLSGDYADRSWFRNPANGLTTQQADLAEILSDRQIDRKTFAGGKRGTPKNNDGFFTINLKISVIIGRERIRR